jgi:hypothetical protein
MCGASTESENIKFDIIMKKTAIKTMQIDNKEFQKCKSGQEFKAKFISHPEPKPPVGMPKWFKVWTETEFKAVKDTLNNVIELNNLKH